MTHTLAVLTGLGVITAVVVAGEQIEQTALIGSRFELGDLARPLEVVISRYLLSAFGTMRVVSS